jgi:hypothetical protein
MSTPTEQLALDVDPDARLRRILATVLTRTPDDWRRKALTVITDLATTGRVFEAYDVVRDGCPEPDHPARWGAIFRVAAQAGLIVSAGAGPSSRPTVHGSLCRKWRGA